MRHSRYTKKGIGAARVRCAIYTRKSSEEGLEQDFNSLDAQREACEAYIKSQAASGWAALDTLYDDGGVSGGTLDRPALQRLLADIEQSKIDTVVVYKVDRLTRSLSDFAKIVDAFDAKQVSFVSVTQHFNTTTSMGRLTLNMLLSFAQFEREVTGERIRDKVAASKKKGMWMGGYPPLGYDPFDRKLVINETEAETVRDIFRRYADLGSVRALKEGLDRDGIISKVRTSQKGRCSGGQPLGPGALYAMLQNPIYRGMIAHKGTTYPGLHDAIVDEALWGEVQKCMAENRVERRTRRSSIAPSLLAGLVFDGGGERMSPTHANRKGTRYRYYVSHSLIRRGRPNASDSACRVPAADLEAIVTDQICTMLRDETLIDTLCGNMSVSRHKAIREQTSDLAERWKQLSASDQRAILGTLIARVTVHRSTVNLSIRFAAIEIVSDPQMDVRSLPTCSDSSTKTFSVPARLKRTGLEKQLLVHGPVGKVPRRNERSLIRILGQAQRYRDMLETAGDKSIRELAKEAGVTGSYFTRVLRLSFLAPSITKSILQGRHPPQLTANRLVNIGKLDTTWGAQRVILEFDTSQ